MTISRDSAREVARVKREMLGAGKGDSIRTYGKEFQSNYPECEHEGCRRMKVKDSVYCNTHKGE